MKLRKVVITPEAKQDLDDIYDWVAGQASAIAAQNVMRRIQKKFEGLRTFPERGSVHDTATGLRSIGVDGRAQIAFRIQANSVDIARVFYGGQDWQSALQPDD